MRNLITSPLHSVWAFIGYVLIFVIPLWKIISFLGDLHFVMGYAVPVGNFLATGWGTALLIIVGFGCLIYANYRQRSAPSTPAEASAPTEEQVPATESEESRAAKERLEKAVYQAKQENDSLRGKVRELEMMSPEEYRARQEERRKRIESWRTEIHAHAFDRHPLGTSRFADTETYQEMQPRLPPGTRERFESQLAAVLTFIGPEHLRGREGDRRVLLREVARIEEEWGLV
jgi:hypothetical protein